MQNLWQNQVKSMGIRWYNSIKTDNIHRMKKISKRKLHWKAASFFVQTLLNVTQIQLVTPFLKTLGVDYWEIQVNPIIISEMTQSWSSFSLWQKALHIKGRLLDRIRSSFEFGGSKMIISGFRRLNPRCVEYDNTNRHASNWRWKIFKILLLNLELLPS